MTQTAFRSEVALKRLTQIYKGNMVGSKAGGEAETVRVTTDLGDLLFDKDYEARRQAMHAIYQEQRVIAEMRERGGWRAKPTNGGL